ncbi:nucleotide-diphospho-sugar transferase-domain-containing protein [Cokeromyces recurvatus]|uniref:nucleotide-diphospho-sugar transferase-domain-containing protein n=1 Tax=Cokeromyces recurvatus TaxID=90255 RepID=UPI0022209A5E|nr:nucleotide-diphospho-sugar transferase-domain-containing protein [Cokeromyces recurvatus]KAI7898232.1 nucleotide-diphospho-sugar transferase-domain-containing protein [Cokeromyces recurvatus]
MTAITNNIISEERSVKRVDPITKNKFTEKIQVNILLTAVVNSGMLDHTLNWIESLKRTNQDDKFLVFAIDQGVVDELSRRGYGQQVVLIPDDWFHVPLASEFALWKSNDYRPITHAKTLIVERLLYLDVTVWFSDVDIVFLSPHIRETILLQMVERPNTDIVFSQEVDQKSINSGFYMMRPTPVTKQFLHRIIQEQDTTENFTQQRIMNRVLKSMFSRDYSESPYRLLDMLLFPNGRYYFKMEMPLKLGFQPLMVHANYLVGGQKKEALMKAGLWYNN